MYIIQGSVSQKIHHLTLITGKCLHKKLSTVGDVVRKKAPSDSNCTKLRPYVGPPYKTQDSSGLLTLSSLMLHLHGQKQSMVSIALLKPAC